MTSQRAESEHERIAELEAEVERLADKAERFHKAAVRMAMFRFGQSFLGAERLFQRELAELKAETLGSDAEPWSPHGHGAWVKPSTSSPGRHEAFRYDQHGSCVASEFFDTEAEGIAWACLWTEAVTVGYARRTVRSQPPTREELFNDG